MTASDDGRTAFLDDDTVVLAGADAGAALWNLDSATVAVDFDEPAATSPVTAVAVAPDKATVALAGAVTVDGEDALSGWAAVYRAVTGELVNELFAQMAAPWRWPAPVSPACGIRPPGRSC